MARRTVEDLVLKRLDEFGGKMDKLTTETIPSLVTAIAIVEVKTKEKAKAAAQLYGTVYGAITIVISLAGLAIAFFK